MKVHCFFEQSGTFKKEFNNLGISALDYDIQNQYGQTDIIIDLFDQIKKEYNKTNTITIFDTIKSEDIIFAFFPCERFTHRMIINFRHKSTSNFIYDDIKKLEENIKFFNEINEYYEIISKLVIICLRKKLKLIIENPYNERHILRQFWHFDPAIIDYDRTYRGDKFKKPTQYFFFNLEPKRNIIIEPQIWNGYKRVEDYNNPAERSMITKEYANRFIREFII